MGLFSWLASLGDSGAVDVEPTTYVSPSVEYSPFNGYGTACDYEVSAEAYDPFANTSYTGIYDSGSSWDSSGSSFPTFD